MKQQIDASFKETIIQKIQTHYNKILIKTKRKKVKFILEETKEFSKLNLRINFKSTKISSINKEKHFIHKITNKKIFCWR